MPFDVSYISRDESLLPVRMSFYNSIIILLLAFIFILKSLIPAVVMNHCFKRSGNRHKYTRIQYFWNIMNFSKYICLYYINTDWGLGNTYLVEIGDVVFDNFCMSLIKKIRLKLFPLKPNRMPIDVIKPHIIVRHFWNTEPFRFHLVWFCYLSCKLVQHIAIFYVIWAYDWIIC